MVSSTIRVLTLNCWDLPIKLRCPDRDKRVEAIGNFLAKSDYDIVALQEIWRESDYEFLKKSLKQKLPYAFYFHSGFVGSGVCIFSQGPIVDSVMHRYSLNGYPHHLHRGDWFGGKVVGMLHVLLKNLHVNIYATHFHAKYNHECDMYLPHRLVQAYELSQFVKSTSKAADLTLVLGDLNMEENEVGLRMVTENAMLNDAWVVANKDLGHADGKTCDRPDNPYTKVKNATPHGIRIDYILYRAKEGIKLTECKLSMRTIPGETIPFSDHEGVEATFDIDSLASSGGPSRVLSTLSESGRSIMSEGVSVLETGLEKVSRDQKWYTLTLFVLVLVYLFTVDMELTYVRMAPVILVWRFVISLFMGFCFWYGIVMLTMEKKALTTSRAGINILLQNQDVTDVGSSV